MYVKFCDTYVCMCVVYIMYVMYVCYMCMLCMYGMYVRISCMSVMYVNGDMLCMLVGLCMFRMSVM